VFLAQLLVAFGFHTDAWQPIYRRSSFAIPWWDWRRCAIRHRSRVWSIIPPDEDEEASSDGALSIQQV
jgi:hypothetical protein